MLYRVFFNAQANCLGSRFRIFSDYPKQPDFSEEYTVINATTQTDIVFYQNGQAFQFCGAGALCVAHYLLNCIENTPNLTDNVSPSPLAKINLTPDSAVELTSNGYCFQLLSAKINNHSLPAVGLPAITQKCYTRHATATGELLYFPEQGVGLYLLANTQAVTEFVPEYQTEAATVNTVIAVYWSLELQHIEFRYFTQFNNKGEDQATGSVFRYLSALSLPKNRWYRVTQASKNGAEMYCQLKDNQLIYTGKVEPII